MAVQRLHDHAVDISHGRDHGTSVSVYLSDPDGNGLELYYDLPRDQWRDANGRLKGKNDPLDWEELLGG